MAETNKPVDRLAELRDEMTNATEEFVRALNKCSTIALAIGEEKARRGITQVRDLEREQQVLDHVAEINEGPLAGKAVQRVVQAAMNASSDLQVEATGLPLHPYPVDASSFTPAVEVPLLRRNGW